MRHVCTATVIIFVINNWFISGVPSQIRINYPLSLIKRTTKLDTTLVQRGAGGTFAIITSCGNIAEGSRAESAFVVMQTTGNNPLLNAGDSIGSAGQYIYSPILIKEIEEDLGNPITDPHNVISIYEALGFTVPIKAQSDISKIRSSGVFIEIQETDYVVILGDQKRIDAIKTLGFTVREIKRE